MVEEKKPAVNLAELLKQTGIVDDDESFFMEEEPPAAAAPQPLPTPQVQIQMDPPMPPVETKENNVYINSLRCYHDEFTFLNLSTFNV